MFENFKVMKITNLLSCTSLLAAISLSAPVEYSSNATISSYVEYNSDIPGWARPTFPELYQTCNSTKRRILQSFIEDSLEVSAYAKDRLLNYGAEDVFFQRWFGNGSIITVLGTLDHLVEASKAGFVFRCDDIDGLCLKNPTTYPGYHRQTADKETVICDLFFQSKKPLVNICYEGAIKDVGPKHYAGVDILHRYLHISSMNMNGFIGEFVEEFDDLAEFASGNSTFAVRNVDSYLYYMADVYSSSVVPGGCL